MNSSMIGKIEKARRYAQEPDRIQFTDLSVRFRGENDTHVVNFSNDKWHCTCNFFVGWGTCSHTMALERLLGKMLPKEAIQSPLQQVAGAEASA